MQENLKEVLEGGRNRKDSAHICKQLRDLHAGADRFSSVRLPSFWKCLSYVYNYVGLAYLLLISPEQLQGRYLVFIFDFFLIWYSDVQCGLTVH